MADDRSTLQIQSPLKDAQQSVAKAEHAVIQAQSHPNDTTLMQAQNSIEHAQKAVEQADASMNQQAYESLASHLNQVDAKLARAQALAPNMSADQASQ